MPDAYRLDFLGRARREFGAALARLSGQKRLDAIAAMERVLEKLKIRPTEFGEELYNLKSLGMQVRHGLILPFAVSVGVDQTHRIVIIQTVTLLG